jgi:hypothetical protein
MVWKSEKNILQGRSIWSAQIQNKRQENIITGYPSFSQVSEAVNVAISITLSVNPLHWVPSIPEQSNWGIPLSSEGCACSRVSLP